MTRAWNRWVLVTALLASFVGLPGAADVTSCPDPCTISASVSLVATPGFDPAVANLQNATNVTWHSGDSIFHKMVDTGTGGTCFQASAGDGEDSAPLLFEVWDGALRVTSSTTTTVCANGHATGTGSFVLAYKCILHLSMNGAIVVSAA